MRVFAIALLLMMIFPILAQAARRSPKAKEIRVINSSPHKGSRSKKASRSP